VKLEIIKKSSEFVADFSNFAEEKIFDGNDIGKMLRRSAEEQLGSIHSTRDPFPSPEEQLRSG
jgi:hypothetical protein